MNESVSSLANVEHADLFASAIEAALAETDRKHQYKQNLKSLEAFLKGRYSLAGKAYEVLNAAWGELVNRFPSSNPEQTVADYLCQRYDDATFKLVTDPNAPEARKWAAVVAFVDARFKMLDEFVRLHAKIKADDSSEAERIELALEGLPKVRSYFDRVMDAKERAFLFCDSRVGRRQPDARVAKHARQRFHPYLARGSNEEVHGTHVAGIIARQSPKIDIVPIRVVTSTPPFLPEPVRPLSEASKPGFRTRSRSKAPRRSCGALEAAARQACSK